MILYLYKLDLHFFEIQEITKNSSIISIININIYLAKQCTSTCITIGTKSYVITSLSISRSY